MNDQLWVCDGGVRYCMWNGISGAGKRNLQYDGLYCETVGCIASGGIPSIHDRQSRERVVGISHCGNDITSYNNLLLGSDLQECDPVYIVNDMTNFCFRLLQEPYM